MFAVLALAPVSQTQSPGLPWWFWLLLLVIVILAFILWQRRSQTRKASPAEVRAPEPVPTVEAPPLPEAAAATPAAGAEAVDAVKAVAGEAAAKVTAVEAPLAEAVAAVAAPKRASRAWKSPTWRTREWQPQPPAWYPKWKHRRPTSS